MKTLLLYWQLRIWGALWQDCLAEVRARLEEAVQRLRLPKWPRAAADAWRPAAVLLARRFGKALRLMRAVAAFEGTLARGPLCALAIERLLPQVHSFHCFWTSLFLRKASHNMVCHATSKAPICRSHANVFLLHAHLHGYVRCLLPQTLSTVKRHNQLPMR